MAITWQPIAEAAQQLIERLAKRLPDRVPHRDIYCRYRLHERRVICQVDGMNAPIREAKLGAAKHRLPMALDIENIAADQQLENGPLISPAIAF